VLVSLRVTTKNKNDKLRTQTTTNVGEDVGKKKPSYTAGGNVN
jgi:hypothetical protein